MPTLSPPLGYRRIRVVDSFERLLATPMTAGVNAICWARQPAGDFAAVSTALVARRGVTTLDDELLRSLPLRAAGRAAIDTLLADRDRLRAAGHEPTLDCIESYPRDDAADDLSTDVHSFHVDSATVPTETFLCSYTGPASEGLRNDEATRRIDVPAARAQLLASYGGADDAVFGDWLAATCHDLHYQPNAGAQPFSFGVGNLWRIAVAHPGCPVPACIHRAPQTVAGQAPRLLLIS